MAPSVASVLQYTALAVLAYVLAGAPFLAVFTGSTAKLGGRSERKKEVHSFDRGEGLVVPERNLSCKKHTYNTHVFSRDPLVVYIEGFLSDEEASHVVEMSEKKFEPSTVWTGGREHLDPTVRKSEKAQLDRDEIVKCIEERARTFQGWRPFVFIEKLWSQRYTKSGHYRHHYDWSSSTGTSGRISSFMVYLEANCIGGGTNFPRLARREGAWCRFVECGEEGEEEEGKYEGVTFKPIKGNAVYWENLRSDGSGYEESWHAGLPVKSGTKIGLNIWSWYQEGYVPAELEKQNTAEM
ncbi:hypothetical protein P154DRAFT_622046 [Amniculicola lignicola CBS 123094]|uniref:Prolyl 4-hydroxylase alpha subunit domain-containing protein n=1 Tax=Amniculicola lignicola CBS 123094 TaxID=1392246 RepID=A0A6A5WBB1_9PLEO|nr:hypothetical protein P154DRAFT_622046 [Amniculicola lignicola CBS 123094]